MKSLVKSGDFLYPVLDEMERVEKLMRCQAVDRHPELGAALQHLLSSGGKRVRPALALLMGEMLGGDKDRLVTLAAAIELLHTATLVHDDLIDGAFLRRGIATLNSQWSPAATVLTGDFIFSRAAKLAAETESVAVMQLFAETLTTIVNGEITQLFESRGLASRENYEKRIYAKTASLFELATTAPALLSPVSEAVVDASREFGNSIGLAFQIVDDILDFTSEQVRLGKPVASDLRQGLITLPALYYLEAFPDDPDMAQLIKVGRINDAGIDRLVKSIRDSGAIEKSMAEAKRFADRGLEILFEFPEGTERRALENLTRYHVDRDI